MVCGIPAQTPTRITAGSAQVKLESQSVVSPGMWKRRRISFRIPACGWKKSFHMIPTITDGIAQGTSASERASQRPLQVLAEQEREAEREAEADRRHGDRPDQADLERVDEEVVVDQRPEVVEPDEASCRSSGRPASR